MVRLCHRVQAFKDVEERYEHHTGGDAKGREDLGAGETEREDGKCRSDGGGGRDVGGGEGDAGQGERRRVGDGDESAGNDEGVKIGVYSSSGGV